MRESEREIRNNGKRKWNSPDILKMREKEREIRMNGERKYSSRDNLNENINKSDYK